jgi:hypothetical protein
MKRYSLTILTFLVITASMLTGLAQAQESVFPLPAPLYILTSEHQLLSVNPKTGGQVPITLEGERVADFDIAPDGRWYVCRKWENDAVIVSDMWTGMGYVLEFGASPPSESGPGKTVAWSPDVAAIAYIVPDGVRVAELGADEYGGPLFSTIQGPWVELYWADAVTIIASDVTGHTTRISGTYDQWTVEQVTGVDVREQPPIPSYLTADGLVMDNQTVIPRTAGTLAFEWAVPPPPVVAGLVMHTDLYFFAYDDKGKAQVWQLPRTGEPPQPLTAESADVIAYALSPDQSEIAYVVADRLIVTDLNGADRRLVATLQLKRLWVRVAWNPDGTQLAFHDGRGVWTVPADGSRPQRALIANQQSENQADAVNDQLYFDPRWSPDGTRLLVGIAYWESAGLGVVDVTTGNLTPLTNLASNQSRWTNDGRVIVWAWHWGFEAPGLFLIDPAAPDAEPVSVLKSGTPVVDVVQRLKGDWFALVASTTQIGPQYLRVLGAATLEGPFLPVAGNTASGFADLPQLAVPEQSGAILVAGQRGLTYNDHGQASGGLIILNLSTGESVQIQTGRLVWDMQWSQ